MQPPFPAEPPGADTRPLMELVPLGAINELAAEVAAGHLQAILELATDILPTHPMPEAAFMSARRQYDAVKIINHLAAVESIRAPICLGLTSSDMGTPILTYVYGESQLGGRVAVVSFYRLTTAGRETALERLSKLSLHEVGHVLGLGHCWEYSCLMRSIRNIDQLDKLEMAFCESCTYELGRRVHQLKARGAGSNDTPGARDPSLT
jgi:archaemetzincin